MRIAYVDPQSYHGLAKYDLGYLRGLLDAGFDGEVFFYCSTLFDGRAPASVEVKPIFDYNRKRSPVLKALFYGRSMVRLAVEALSTPAVVYHFQWFKLPWLDHLFVAFIQKVAGARVVMTAHNVVPHGEEHRRHRSLRRLYRAVDAVVVHHSKTASEIAARFGVDESRIFVLRHGPIKIDGRGRARHRRSLKRFAAQFDVCFLFLGRGSRYKGLDVLLDAWTRFARGATVVGASTCRDGNCETAARDAAGMSGDARDADSRGGAARNANGTGASAGCAGGIVGSANGSGTFSRAAPTAGARGKAGLIVIGAVDDEIKDAAERASREHDSLLLIDEYVAEADLHHAMRWADVVVLPHRRISQSGVLLSALARRKPVLVAPRAGLVEPLELANVGWQFDGGPADLAERLAFIARHPEEIARIRGDDEAWKIVQEAYAWRNIGRRATKVYAGLISGPARNAASSDAES